LRSPELSSRSSTRSTSSWASVRKCRRKSSAIPPIGHGDIDWDQTFAALRDVAFDGIAAVCVFGWEEDADAIHRRMLDRVTSGLTAPAR
jgi:sugar phosphate isomerase/epimerase